MKPSSPIIGENFEGTFVPTEGSISSLSLSLFIFFLLVFLQVADPFSSCHFGRYTRRFLSFSLMCCCHSSFSRPGILPVVCARRGFGDDSQPDVYFFFLLELGKRWRWIMHGIIDSDSPTGSNVTRRFSIVERIRLFPRQISLSTTKQQQHRKDIRRVE